MARGGSTADAGSEMLCTYGLFKEFTYFFGYYLFKYYTYNYWEA